MALKSATYQFKGMNRDLSNMNASKDYAYEIRNMKITANEDNTLFSISSIKGPKDTSISIKGTPIGQCVVDNQWVIFSSGISGVAYSQDLQVEDGPIGDITVVSSESIEDAEPITDDYIYLISNTDKGLEVYVTTGSLNLSTNNPIEAISFVENEEIKKIYWTDGLNQPRFITTKRIEQGDPITSNEIDFIPEVKSSNEEVTITKNINTIGMFPAGTTQYAFSYINYYGQQSNIFHISSIYYNVSKDKALEVNKTSSDSYYIDIKGLNNTEYQYVRIYSIVRTSQDSTPEVRVVADYKLEDDTLKYTDRHTTGYSIDPTELFYIGGEQLVIGTMTQKDNTLFIGDITQKKQRLNQDLINSLIQNAEIKFMHWEGKDVSTAKKRIKSYVSSYYDDNFDLKYRSKTITTFKGGNYYRFGIQFQDKSGRWSEPVFIKDVKNDFYPITWYNPENEDKTKVLSYAKLFIDKNIVSEFIKSSNYIKARPLIVYPELEDRVVLCQGYLSPTVYNVKERDTTNGIYAQSSWFARPFFNDQYNSRNVDLIHLNNDTKTREEDYGALLEFRHNARVGSEYTRHSEFQCTTEKSYDLNTDKTLEGISFCCFPNNHDDYINKRSQDFFVDSSIVTMHSPEIEFDDSFKSLDLNNYKLRIVGYVPLTSHQGNIDIITSTSSIGQSVGNYDTLKGNNGYTTVGFYNKRLGNIKNVSKYGSRILCSGVFYRDFYNFLYTNNGTIRYHKFNSSPETDKYLTYNSNIFYYQGTIGEESLPERLKAPVGFHIFPFQCMGDIFPKHSDDTVYEGVNNTLQYKKLSNVRYSYGNKYITENMEDINTYSINLFNSDSTSTIRIKNHAGEYVQYQGNVDSIITPKVLDAENKLVSGCYRYSDPHIARIESLKPIINRLISLTPEEADLVNPMCNHESIQTDPIIMKYKSSPHIVISFKGDNKRQQRYLPNLLKNGNHINRQPTVITDKWKPFWQCANSDYINDTKPIAAYDISNFDYSGLWLAELYQDINEEFIFGGTSTQAIANNKWNIAGDSVLLDSNKDLELYYTEGDTYYQRYDNLKTYPWSMEEVNGITDVISFMVETRINLEGRYDSNKADKPHFHILPSNFNLINKAYTQKNNFFEYYGVDYDRVEVNKYPNLISWSKTKTAGELTDTWLNLNLSSTLDLDGNCGKITSLQNYNGQIFAFQEKAINQILYNEQTQISTSAGVPIEIANSGKVTGYRNYSNQVGCSNKWSICQTPNGLYFLDSFNKDLYKIGESLSNLSSTNGFNTYLRSIPNIEKPWDPVNKYSIKTSYDPINKEVLFSTDKETLSYSEQLQSFMSFYNFKAEYMSTLNGNTLILGETDLNNDIPVTPVYKYQEGLYNYQYGKQVPYYVEFIANPDPLNDKIFNVLEFRSDSWDDANTLQNFKSFNKITVNNEYQEATSPLEYGKNLKKRFRIWKAQIPRQIRSDSPLQSRIRNTWAKIKLESTADNNNLNTVLHDITVHYSV